MKTKIGKLVLVAAIIIVGAAGIRASSLELMTEVDMEPELAIESWMVDEIFWNSETIDLTPATEKSLPIEKWMYDDAYWK